MAIAILALSLGLPASGSTYTVNNLGDTSDATPGDDICDAGGGVCTLRAAIEEANAHAGSDTIIFSVAGVISTTSTLPVTDTAIIDGTTAPGYAGVPLVHLSASVVPVALVFSGPSSVLTAVEVSGYFTAGVDILGTGVTIQRCYIGPITSGGANGIGIRVSGANDLIGGIDGSGNVISGNNQHGIRVTGSSTTISDNFIGTNAAGTGGFQNGFNGIDIDGASNTQIGPTSANAQNVISGNGMNGVSISNAQNVTVAGNFIGTNLAGTAAVTNFGSGISISNSTNSTIGTSSGRNVISGNAGQGIFVPDNSPGTVIDNNYIGTDVTGAAAVPNHDGIGCASSTVTIGSSSGNVISGNFFDGVGIGSSTSSFVSVRHNIIGLDATGANILANGEDGVSVCCNASSATIGDTNVISGNGRNGIFVFHASNVTIDGNIIGLRQDGTDIRGNGNNGIAADTAANLIIGGATAAARNVISGNSAAGVIVENGTNAVTISGNFIGTDVTGLLDFGNAGDGIAVLFSPNGSTITGNVIFGNGGNGVDLLVADNNTLTGNVIASNAMAGVYDAAPTDNNVFSNNSYVSNGGLGIELDPPGVNANDPQDADTGANSRQNFPVISYATQVQIAGTINSNPNTTLSIDLYSNTAADPSGFGEGETRLPGNASVTTDGNGDASFIIFYGSPIPLGRIITATATGPHGTSEFSQANVTVVAPPVLQFSSATYNVAENGGSATITVTRTGETNSLATVQYSTSPGTASPSSDYVPAVGTLGFPAGVTSQTFSVPITNDVIDEPNETLTLTLSNPGSATLGLSSATLTINDDDPPPSIAINNVHQAEGNSGTSNMTFTVSLSNPSASTITIDFATANGIAIAGSDYVTTGGTLTFNPGVMTQQVNVPIIGDPAMEPDETFFVNLSNPANATIANAQGIGTITNDDVVAIPTLSEWMLVLLAALLACAATTRWKA